MVLGAGPAGCAAALRAAARGAKVCLVESGQVGGLCLNAGCIPSKAMLYYSGLLWEMRRAGQFGLSTGLLQVDGAVLMRRVKETVAGLRQRVERLLACRKVELLRGRGQVVDPHTVEVATDKGNRVIVGRDLIVATGSRPVRPAWLPWGTGPVWTPEEAMRAEELPRSVLIVGGGPVGCELATLYGELGIPTTLVEMQPRLLPGFEADCSGIVEQSLRQRGVAVMTGRQVVGMRVGAEGLVADLGDGQTLSARRAIAALGRHDAMAESGLERLDLATDDGVIVVDDRCRTSVEGVYAAGDVADGRRNAHLATRMGIVAAENATGQDAVDDRAAAASCVWTHPSVAAVGLREDQAAAAGHHVRVSRFPYAAVGLARACGQEAGFVRLVGEASSGRLLGGTVVGPQATEVIQEVVLALRRRLTVADLAEVIHSHPTFVEAVGESAMAWLGLPLYSAGLAQTPMEAQWQRP